MVRGKDICNELKAVRRRIAEENDIPLEIPECPHRGPCAGTCPQCEKELRQLETALADRMRLGKVATVAGIALALASPALAQTDKPQHQKEPQQKEMNINSAQKYQVCGTVLDAKTKEPLPFVNIVASNSVLKYHAATDFNGTFRMELPAGKYTLQASSPGYKPVVKTVKISNKEEALNIEMKMQPSSTGLVPVDIAGMVDYRVPVIEIGDGTMSNEREGIQVRVQY